MKNYNKKELVTLIKILKGLRDFIEHDPEFTDGLCWALRRLYHGSQLTVYEYHLITVYLKENKPDKTVDNVTFGFWWKPNIKETRLKWIDKQLKLLDDEK